MDYLKLLRPDADNDGFPDEKENLFGTDPANSASKPETKLYSPTCYDGLDNDLDDTIDSKDPGCPGFNVTSFPTAFLLPLYRPSDWEAYLDAIGPHLAPKDYVVVVVGSPESAGIPSAAMTNLLEKIHKDYPEVEPMIMTAGIANLRQLVSNDLIPNYVNWVGYDYEEGFETEFNWDLQQTKINFQNAGAIVHGAGKKFFTSPQGKNLFDTSLPQWDWNVLAPLQEMVLYQTQHLPNIGDGRSFFLSKVHELKPIFANNNVEFFPELTVGDPATEISVPNGITISHAENLSLSLIEDGFKGIFIWYGHYETPGVITPEISSYLTKFDLQAPTVSITAPANGATVSDTISITADAADNVGVTKVEFYVDTSTKIGEDTTSPYSISWNTNTVSNGAHNLLARAYDAVGNSSSKSVTVTVSNLKVITLRPVADATISKSYPKTNYGSSPYLIDDYNPYRNFLMKFSISGIGSGKVTSAKLRLYVQNPSPLGGLFYNTTTTTWSEKTVTWNSRPAVSSRLATLGRVYSGRWYSVDLTKYITKDGTLSLRVMSTYSDGAIFYSKEKGSSYAPQLVITVQ